MGLICCETPSLSRRALLTAGGTLFAWAYLPKFAFAASSRDPRLVVIILRGALDGLSAAGPVGDPAYAGLHGQIALSLTGEHAALPLDGFFALNPAMPVFARLYKQGHAAVVHATATAYRDRSHFDGQDVLESGHAGPGFVQSGWLNRAIEALPKGDPNDNDTLRKFAAAVLTAEPTAIGGPVSILKSGDTVVKAFIHAGIGALLVISLLLWLALRRVTDVLLTLVPLLVAGAVTMEICVLIGLPLNFANIVALPLMLGIGVAFKIYYVTAWRSGRTNLLQTSLTRAIFFSALTTATAFGSLWLSSHPGTASMGKLLALSLVTTLAAVLLFQPALMGKPRDVGE